MKTLVKTEMVKSEIVKSVIKNCARIGSLSLLLALAACSNGSDPETNAVLADSAIKLDVYKSPTCACCQDWIDYVEEDGFQTLTHHPANLGALKQQHGISAGLQSCHTAVSEQGYVFEGHVPSQLVKRFLDNPPKGAIGLAVPGMPIGSPGMEMGDRIDQYSVWLLYKDGRKEHFAEMRGQEIIDG